MVKTCIATVLLAGELLEDEVQEAGIEGVVPDRELEPSQELHEVVDWFEWTPEQVETAKTALMTAHPLGQRLMAAITSSFFTGVMKYSEMSEVEREAARQNDPDFEPSEDSFVYLLEDGKEPDPSLAMDIENDPALQALANRIFKCRQQTLRKQ